MQLQAITGSGLVEALERLRKELFHPALSLGCGLCLLPTSSVFQKVSLRCGVREDSVHMGVWKCFVCWQHSYRGPQYAVSVSSGGQQVQGS